MQTGICSFSLWPVHFVLGLVTEVSVVLTSCCQWRRHMAFSGPHGGCVGFNPHESLCWIQSSHLRQLILKYWNSSNCKNGSETSQIWSVDVSSGVNIAIKGCKKTFQRSTLQPGKWEWKNQHILQEFPPWSVLSCWWGTEVPLYLWNLSSLQQFQCFRVSDKCWWSALQFIYFFFLILRFFCRSSLSH